MRSCVNQERERLLRTVGCGLIPFSSGITRKQHIAGRTGKHVKNLRTANVFIGSRSDVATTKYQKNRTFYQDRPDVVKWVYSIPVDVPRVSCLHIWYLCEIWVDVLSDVRHFSCEQWRICLIVINSQKWSLQLGFQITIKLEPIKVINYLGIDSLTSTRGVEIRRSDSGLPIKLEPVQVIHYFKLETDLLTSTSGCWDLT